MTLSTEDRELLHGHYEWIAARYRDIDPEVAGLADGLARRYAPEPEPRERTLRTLRTLGACRDLYATNETTWRLTPEQRQRDWPDGVCGQCGRPFDAHLSEAEYVELQLDAAVEVGAR